MAEHIKMTPQEAKQKAEGIRKIILDTYHQEVKPSPFFSELRAGTLSRKQLQGWIKNWYSFALEVNTGMATAYHQFVGFRSEEHTSELQSLTNLVCRLLL